MPTALKNKLMTHAPLTEEGPQPSPTKGLEGTRASLRSGLLALLGAIGRYERNKKLVFPPWLLRSMPSASLLRAMDNYRFGLEAARGPKE